LNHFTNFGFSAHAIFSVGGPSPRSDLEKISPCRANSFEESGWLLLAVGSRLAKPGLSWIAIMAINTISDRRLHDQSALFTAQAVPFGSELFAAAPPGALATMRWSFCRI
jgi:hypothetical protein